MALEQELATYRRLLLALVAQHGEGRWVVIAGDTVLGVRDSLEAALGLGYDVVGLAPFLVKQVHAVEPVLYFPRDLRPGP